MNSNRLLEGVQVEKNSALENRLEQARKSLPYKIEYAQQNFADELWEAMEDRNLNQVQFASNADVSKQFLTKVFQGGNCTIATMIKLAFAINYNVSIHLTRAEIGCAWMHWKNEASPRANDRLHKLWTESGYKPMPLKMKRPNSDKVAA